MSGTIQPSTSTKSTDLGKGPLIPGSTGKANKSCQSVTQSAAGTYNLPGLASVTNIHIHIYLIVLQQVLVPASGFSTSDCIHVLSSSFFFNFHFQYFQVTDKGADARSCIQSINTLPCRRKVQRSAAAELYTVRAANFHSRTINRFLRSSMLTPVLRVGSSVCDHYSQSSECRIAERWIFKVHKQYMLSSSRSW